MRHNQLTMIAPLEENRRKPLKTFLEEEVGYQCADRRGNALLKDIAELHFISMFTFVSPGGGRNPEGYLVIEASFDGPVDAFLEKFTTKFEQPLNFVLDHCKRRPNESATEFIRRYSYQPECFYVSCPGLTRREIDTERELLELLEAETATLVHEGPAAYRDPGTVVARMREAARGSDLLACPPLPDPFAVEYGKAILIALGVLAAMILAALCVLAIGRWHLIEEIGRQLLFPAVLGFLILAAAYRFAGAKKRILATSMVLLVVLASAAGTAAVSQILPAGAFATARYALAGLAVIIGAIALGLYKIELLERRDHISTGWIDIDRMRKVCHDENPPGTIHNHFINLSIVKPGALRRWTLRLVLCIVHWAGILYFNKGKLGGIPSIHFARWVMLGKEEFGQPLLLFLTNYDGSWDSYLGDFVDEASEGVSGIWSNTGGFPRTWGVIVAGGSRSEKQFKAYAREGQQRTSAWFSAYPNLSVPQKLSNAALRRALDKGNLDTGAQDELLRRL